MFFSLSLSASSVVSSYGPTSATRDHEKRILESILPPDLRHLVHGSSSSAIHVNTSNSFSFPSNYTSASLSCVLSFVHMGPEIVGLFLGASAEIRSESKQISLFRFFFYNQARQLKSALNQNNYSKIDFSLIIRRLG